MDDLQDLLIQHPKLLQIMLGELELMDMVFLVKRFRAEGLSKDAAKEAAIKETEDFQRLNTDIYTILRGVVDLTGVYELEDNRKLKEQFSQGVLRDGRGYMVWISKWSTTMTLTDQKRVRSRLSSLTVPLNVKVSALSTTLNTAYDLWLKLKGNSADDPASYIDHVAELLPSSPDTAKIVIVRNALAKKIMKHAELLEDARATINWIVEYYDKLMGSPDESRQGDGGARATADPGDGGAIMQIGGSSDRPPPSTGRKERHPDNKNKCDSCHSWVCSKPSGVCIITKAMKGDAEYKAVLKLCPEARGKQYIASAVAYRKANPTITNIKKKKFKFIKIDEHGNPVSKQDGEQMTPMMGSDGDNMFGLSPEQLDQLNNMHTGEVLCVLAGEEEGAIERMQVFVEDMDDEDDESQSDGACKVCDTCSIAGCGGCHTPTLPTSRTTDALEAATRALQVSQANMQSRLDQIESMATEIANLKKRLQEEAAATPSTAPKPDQAARTGSKSVPLQSPTAKMVLGSSPEMTPIPTAAEIDKIIDELSVDGKKDSTTNDDLLRAKMADDTAHKAVNAALMSLAVMEREHKRIVRAEKEREQSRKADVESDKQERRGFITKLLDYIRPSGGSKIEHTGTKALSSAVLAMSKLSDENAKLRSDKMLTPLRVMIGTILACKIGPNIWPVVCQQIAVLLRAARKQLYAYVKHAAFTSAQALVSVTVRLIKQLLNRALTGVSSTTVVESMATPPPPVSDSVMLVTEVVTETLMPMPELASAAPGPGSKSQQAHQFGLFDDGATSHFTKSNLGKIAGTRQLVKSTFATGTNKTGARPSESNLHAIVLISADGEEEEPRVERMNFTQDLVADTIFSELKERYQRRSTTIGDPDKGMGFITSSKKHMKCHTGTSGLAWLRYRALRPDEHHLMPRLIQEYMEAEKRARSPGVLAAMMDATTSKSPATASCSAASHVPKSEVSKKMAPLTIKPTAVTTDKSSIGKPRVKLSGIEILRRQHSIGHPSLAEMIRTLSLAGLPEGTITADDIQAFAREICVWCNLWRGKRAPTKTPMDLTTPPVGKSWIYDSLELPEKQAESGMRYLHRFIDQASRQKRTYASDRMFTELMIEMTDKLRAYVRPDHGEIGSITRDANSSMDAKMFTHYLDKASVLDKSAAERIHEPVGAVEVSWQHDVPKVMAQLEVANMGDDAPKHILTSFFHQEAVSNAMVVTGTSPPRSANMVYYGQAQPQLAHLLPYGSPCTILYQGDDPQRPDKWHSHKRVAKYMGPSRRIESNQYALFWDPHRNGDKGGHVSAKLAETDFDEGVIVARMNSTMLEHLPDEERERSGVAVPAIPLPASESAFIWQALSAGSTSIPDAWRTGDNVYSIYYYSSTSCEGDLQAHLYSLSDGKHHLVCIDTDRGGYGHDVLNDAVLEASLRDVSHPACASVIITTDCAPWSSLRFLPPPPGKPKAEVLFDMNNKDGKTFGNATDTTVLRAFKHATVAGRIIEHATANTKGLHVEHPTQRREGTHSIHGCELHSTLLDTTPVAAAIADSGATVTKIDRCAANELQQKTSDLVHSYGDVGIHNYGDLRCKHNAKHPRPVLRESLDGSFSSTESGKFSSHLNRLIAMTILGVKKDKDEFTPRVGEKIEVFWSEDRKWWPGVVKGISTQDGLRTIEVKYDDGATRTHVLQSSFVRQKGSGAALTATNAAAAGASTAARPGLTRLLAPATGCASTHEPPASASTAVWTGNSACTATYESSSPSCTDPGGNGFDVGFWRAGGGDA